MRNCHIRDCVALMKYFGWLENELRTNPNSGLTEYGAAQKIDYYRSEG